MLLSNMYCIIDVSFICIHAPILCKSSAFAEMEKFLKESQQELDVPYSNINNDQQLDTVPASGDENMNFVMIIVESNVHMNTHILGILYY